MFKQNKIKEQKFRSHAGLKTIKQKYNYLCNPVKKGF